MAGPKLDELMNELREEFENSPPYPGNYLPTKNDICAAKYSADNQWYRARILKNAKDGVLVSFIDFGNVSIEKAHLILINIICFIKILTEKKLTTWLKNIKIVLFL